MYNHQMYGVFEVYSGAGIVLFCMHALGMGRDSTHPVHQTTYTVLVLHRPDWGSGRYPAKSVTRARPHAHLGMPIAIGNDDSSTMH